MSHDEKGAWVYLATSAGSAIKLVACQRNPSLEMAFQLAQVFRVPLDAAFQYPDREGTQA
jgi:DNA-binding XRE family transcriptional regulator